MMRVQLKTFLLPVGIITSFCIYNPFLNAQQQNPSVGASSTIGMTPPRAMALSQDPFMNVSFQMCMSTGNKTTKVDSFTQATNAALSKIKGTSKDKKTGSKAADAAQAAVDLTQCDDEELENIIPDKNACSKYSFNSKKYTSKDGKTKYFDENSIEGLRERLDNKATCQRNKAKFAETAAGCFQDQFTKLKKDMEMVRKDFEENMAGMKKYIDQVDSAIKKQEGISQTLGANSDGDKPSGQMGQFVNLQQEVQKAVMSLKSGMGSKEKGSGSYDYLAQQVNLAKKNFDDIEKQRTMEHQKRTMDCMSKDPLLSESSFANTDCPHSTATECVIYQYNRERYDFYNNGQTRQNPAASKRAEYDTAKFRQRMSQFLSKYFNQDNSTQYTNVDEFLSQYAGEISAWGKGGQSFVREFKKCGAAKSKELDKEIKNEVGYGEKYKRWFEEEARTVHAGLEEVTTGLDQVMRDTVKVATGSEANYTFSTDGCTKSTATFNGRAVYSKKDLDRELGCIKYMRDSLNAMLNGQPQPGPNGQGFGPVFQMKMKDANGNETLCMGIRDCIAKTQSEIGKSQNRINDLKGESGDGKFADSSCQGGRCPGKLKFVNDSNANIKTAFDQAAQLFGNRVAMADQYMKQMQQMFKDAGIAFPSIPETEKEPFACESQGKSAESATICKLPTDFGKALANASGLTMIGPEKFEDAIKQAKDRQKEVAKSQATAKEKLATFIDHCKQKDKEAIQSALSQYQKRKTDYYNACSDKAVVQYGSKNTSELANLMNNTETDANNPATGKLDELFKDVESFCERIPDANRSECESLRDDIKSQKELCTITGIRQAYDAQMKKESTPQVYQIAAPAAANAGSTVPAGTTPSTTNSSNP